MTEEIKEVKHRKAKKLPVFVSQEDLRDILKVAKHKHHKYAYMMGWYSGMRISEILNLEPRDVDMSKGTVFSKTQDLYTPCNLM